MPLFLSFVAPFSFFVGPLLACSGIALVNFRRKERREPRTWDGGRGPGWGATMLLALLSGVAWMLIWYS